jgi:hypothetical protein
MKMKYLITGGLATLGATLALGGVALAATTLDQGLQPFVVADSASQTLSSPAIVVGKGVDTTDVLGAADIAASLVSNYAVETKTIPSAAGTTSATGGALITSDLSKLYLTANYTSVKNALTSTDLPDLLATQSFTDKAAATITVQQLIQLGTQTIQYGKASDFTEPYLYTVFGGSYPYTLKLLFVGGLDTAQIDTSYSIKLFGKTYTFGPTHTNTSLEFYSASGAQVVSLAGVGTEKTVTAGGSDHTMSITGWDDVGNGVYLKIDGQATSPSEWVEGTTYTFPGTTVKVYVNDVSVIQTGGTESTVQVELFIGTDKLELINNTYVERNDETLVYCTSSFTASGSKVNSIDISVAPDVDTYMKDGGEFADPVFGSFKFVMAGMTPAVTDSGRDYVLVAKDGTTKVRLSFTNREGTAYSVPVFYYSSVWNKWVDSSHEFWTTESNSSAAPKPNNITVGDYFVVTKNKRTYVLKYSTYNPSKEYVEFADVATGAKYDVYYNSDSNIRIGAEVFPVTYTAGDHSVIADMNGDGDIALDNIDIYTKNEGVINLYSTAGDVVFVETPLYTLSASGGNDPSGQKLNVSAAYASNDISFSTNATAYGGQVGSANKYRYLTRYGTFVEHDTDADSVKLYYPGIRPAFANVAVGTAPVVSTTGGVAGGTYKQAVPITNPVAKFPDEVTQTSALNRDLILVGGPCANAVVKTLLNEKWSVTDSCTQWMADADLMSSGKGLITVVENVFLSGHKALIVAGTDAVDTRNLIANFVIKPAKMATLTGAEYKGVVV